MHYAWYIFRIHDNRTGLAVGVTGQQGMLTPPRHLIPPSFFPRVRVSPFVYLTCNSYWNFETDYSSVSWPFHFSTCVSRDVLYLRMSYTTPSQCCISTIGWIKSWILDKTGKTEVPSHSRSNRITILLCSKALGPVSQKDLRLRPEFSVDCISWQKWRFCLKFLA
jgi:hypothetical protein